MSGGSFDYLCYAYDNNGVEGLANASDQLDAMARQLRDYPEAQPAIDATRTVLQLLDDFDRAIREIINVQGLAAVWKAVEWHVDCDWDEQAVIDAIAKFNAKVGDQ